MAVLIKRPNAVHKTFPPPLIVCISFVESSTINSCFILYLFFVSILIESSDQANGKERG